MKTRFLASLSASIFAASLLAACTPEPSRNTTGTGSTTSVRAASSAAASSAAPRPYSKEGETCGGIAALQCEPSLFCKFDGAYPDAAGVCIK